MRRGDVIVGSGPGLAGKPRPVLVVQADSLPFDSVTVCLITTHEPDGVPCRVEVEPSEENGLERRSWVMAEKIFTFKPGQFRKSAGRLSEEDMERVSEQLRKVLGL